MTSKIERKKVKTLHKIQRDFHEKGLAYKHQPKSVVKRKAMKNVKESIKSHKKMMAREDSGARTVMKHSKEDLHKAHEHMKKHGG